MMRLLFISVACLLSTFVWAQPKQADNFLYWSSNRKLTATDFLIKTKDLQTAPSYASFNFTFEIHGFDFLTKNFNRKVQNYLIKSASWIDTTHNIEQSLRYQQGLFDLCEVYARQFRKTLQENRKKIATGLDFLTGLHAKAMTDFSARQIQYDTETVFGTDAVAQYRWQQRIEMELIALKAYSAEQ